MLDESHKKLAEEVFKSVPYINHIGMELTELKEGEATVQLEMRDELRQPQGLLHGGATASLIDTATAFANVTVLEKGQKAVTVDLNLHYLRPVFEGKVICKAKVIKAGKKLSTISAEVFDEYGKLVATALSTYARTL